MFDTPSHLPAAETADRDNDPNRSAASYLTYDSPADGWTPARRAAFLTHLADHGHIDQAAQAVGMSVACAI
jgi:hypothetical protein